MHVNSVAFKGKLQANIEDVHYATHINQNIVSEVSICLLRIMHVGLVFTYEGTRQERQKKHQVEEKRNILIAECVFRVVLAYSFVFLPDLF